uniref:hypothetical protein n=1 Tax=Amycolatopsis sp. CA-082387 TaxID=3239918 RepID=UPI003F4935DB
MSTTTYGRDAFEQVLVTSLGRQRRPVTGDVEDPLDRAVERALGFGPTEAETIDTSLEQQIVTSPPEGQLFHSGGSTCRVFLRLPEPTGYSLSVDLGSALGATRWGPSKPRGARRTLNARAEERHGP